MIRKLFGVAAVVGVTIVVAAGTAFAHVEIERDGAVAVDGTVAATMTVPNEKSDSGTVKIELVFPEAPTMTTATAGPVSGWTATVQKAPSGSVQQITWTGGPLTGDKKVQLPFTLGPVPGTVAAMQLETLQTYENGDVVRWVEATPPGGVEPENPAPVLYVKGSPLPEEPATTTPTKAAKKSSDSGTSTGVIVAIVIGVVLALGLLGFLLSRSWSDMRSSSD